MTARLTLLLLAGCVVAEAQEDCRDVLGLSNGTELRGDLLELSDGHWVMQTDSEQLRIPLADVVRVEACPSEAPEPSTPVATEGDPVDAPEPVPKPVPETAPPPEDVEMLLPRPSSRANRVGTHIGVELNAIGAAFRLDRDVIRNGVDRMGLRVGAGFGLNTYSGYPQGLAFAQLTVSFNTYGPVRLEAASGVYLSSYGPGVIAGFGMLAGSRTIDFRMELAGFVGGYNLGVFPTVGLQLTY